MSDLVGNQEDRFSHDVAHIVLSWVGSVSASCASSLMTDPCVHQSFLETSFPDSRRASCQLVVKECVLNADKMPQEGLSKNSEPWHDSLLTGQLNLNKTKRTFTTCFS